MTTPHKEIASGLRFPEGPVAMPDGSVILVEIARQTLTRVMPNGKCTVIATLGGGPNGAAMGPGGKIFVTNNGGFNWIERPDGRLFPGTQPDDYKGGSIQVVDPETGKFETLYDSCNGRRLNGPNDLVFDNVGGFWFTDLGKTREYDNDRGAVYYAKADGSKIEQKVFPLERPNGCGLSPDEKTLYVVETPTARCCAIRCATSSPRTGPLKKRSIAPPTPPRSAPCGKTSPRRASPRSAPTPRKADCARSCSPSKNSAAARIPSGATAGTAWPSLDAANCRTMSEMMRPSICAPAPNAIWFATFF